MIQVIDELKNLADGTGVEIIEKPNGHIQIKGKLLVNYYPYSKNRTAYVARTKVGKKHVSPVDAFKMSQTPPPVKKEGKRKSNGGLSQKYKKWKVKQIRKGNNKCKWCGKILTAGTATLEHIVPLGRGGLDNPNNWALACAKCNHDRGNNMPELEHTRGK